MDIPIEEWVNYVRNLPHFERRVEIARRVQPRLNRFLYKYKSIDPNEEQSIDRVRDLLVRSRLWLSSPVDFNDPFDMSANIVAKASGRERRERFKDLLKQQGVRYKERERKVREISQKKAEELEKELAAIYRKTLVEVGVFSFAGDPKSILMWSHYAGDHTGICIQFERARDFLTLSNALSVEYSSEYPEVNWIKNFSETLGQKVMLRKHEGWSYEDEHRIVRPGDAHKYLAFSPQAIVRVIMGCRTSTAGREAIEGLLEERSRAKMPPIQQFLAQQHRSKYQLLVVGG